VEEMRCFSYLPALRHNQAQNFDMLVEDQTFFLIVARRAPVIFLGGIFVI
jgi:hypothetical protein